MKVLIFEVLFRDYWLYIGFIFGIFLLAVLGNINDKNP